MLGHATIEVARDADIQRTREVRHDVDLVFSSWHQSSGVGPRILRFAQDDNRAEGPLVSMTEVTSNRAQKLRAHPCAEDRWRRQYVSARLSAGAECRRRGPWAKICGRIFASSRS